MMMENLDFTRRSLATRSMTKIEDKDCHDRLQQKAKCIGLVHLMLPSYGAMLYTCVLCSE